MSKKPKKCISVKEAKMLEKNYVDTIEKALEKSQGCQECREFWWSLEELEDYIKYVKKKAKKKGYKNLGLRFYLGKYGKDVHVHEDGEEHEDMTLFIAPTGVHSTKTLTPIKRAVGAKAAAEDENIKDMDAYNGGHSRKPPKDY